MKKIISLSKVFMKEFYQSLPIFDEKNKKFNKKSLFFWLLVIIFFGVAYVSYEVIKFLVDAGQPEIFLNIYFMILAILLIFQTILICGNVLFFSKDIEKVLHMPLKPAELLLAKFAVLLSMMYATEIIFAVVPLFLYGLLTSSNFVFFLWEPLILLMFPILIAATISVLLLIIMRFTKFIKNKDIFQILVVLILTIIVCLFEFKAGQNVFTVQSEGDAISEFTSVSDRVQAMNKYFLIINPSIQILDTPFSLVAFVHFAKLIFINLLGMLLFLFVGNLTYLKDILNCMVNGVKKKKKFVNTKKEIKSTSVRNAYIKKEFAMLIKQPTFFMQCVFPVLIILVTLIILGVTIFPMVMEALQNEEIQEAVQHLSFNTEVACDILIVIQVLFSISNISLTAISRDGSSATFVKYIPVDLYKQFVYKNIPQIVLNMFVTIVVLGVIWYLVPAIGWNYILAMFVTSTFINLINSYLMLIVDLRRPNLNWDSEYAVVKNSNNKLFQYALMIINILALLYIATIFKEGNLNIYLIIEIAIYAILFIIIDRCVKKWRDKLFNKII